MEYVTNNKIIKIYHNAKAPITNCSKSILKSATGIK